MYAKTANVSTNSARFPEFFAESLAHRYFFSEFPEIRHDFR